MNRRGFLKLLSVAPLAPAVLVSVPVAPVPLKLNHAQKIIINWYWITNDGDLVECAPPIPTDGSVLLDFSEYGYKRNWNSNDPR